MCEITLINQSYEQTHYDKHLIEISIIQTKTKWMNYTSTLIEMAHLLGCGKTGLGPWKAIKFCFKSFRFSIISWMVVIFCSSNWFIRNEENYCLVCHSIRTGFETMFNVQQTHSRQATHVLPYDVINKIKILIDSSTDRMKKKNPKNISGRFIE